MENFLLTSIFYALVLGLIPAFIARSKGRNFKRWYIYGALLFIVAFIHSIFLSDHSGICCPVCKKWIKENATVCKYCHTVIADYYRDHPNTPIEKYEDDDTTLL